MLDEHFHPQWPAEKDRNRKLLAIGVLVGFLGISIGLLGTWTSYILQGEFWQAWNWAFRFSILGDNGQRNLAGTGGNSAERFRWHRFLLLTYWLGVAFLSIGLWQRKVKKSRKFKSQMANTAHAAEKAPSDVLKEDKRSHITLDSRRKAFHALAVILFVPGIAIQVSSRD